MKIVYYDNGQLDMAFFAGLIHFKEFNLKEGVTYRKIKSFLKKYSVHKNKTVLHYWGVDLAGNEVYLLRLNIIPIGLKAIYTVLQSYANPMEWRFFDTNLLINTWYAHLSLLKIKVLNEFLLTVTFRKQLPEIVETIEKFKEQIRYGQT